MNMPTRIERDTMGEVLVPADALCGAQTQRAVDRMWHPDDVGKQGHSNPPKG